MTENTEIETEESSWETENGFPVYRNPVWDNSEHTSFSVDIKHSEFGWIRCSTSPEDTGVAKPLWDARENLEIQEIPSKSLEEIKQELLQKISFESDKFENNKCDSMFITSSLGFRVNADRRSLQNVENLIRIGQETIFKDYDNQFRSVTVQDLETLALEISINGSNLYNQKFRMQNFILNAETAEDLENFEVQFEMMDFTENN